MFSGGTTFLSCNNLNFQGQFNSGNNVLGQDSGNGNEKGGSNSAADQSISQSQSSSQNSLLVSSGSIIIPDNNIKV